MLTEAHLGMTMAACFAIFNFHARPRLRYPLLLSRRVSQADDRSPLADYPFADANRFRPAAGARP
jgi:hypothetical protein